MKQARLLKTAEQRPGLFGLGLSVLLAGTAALTTPVVSLNAGFDSDGLFYGAMAGEPRIPPRLARVAPYAWRWLTPFVVSLLPGDVLAGFRFVSAACAFGSLWLMWALLGTFGLSLLPRIAGLFLYAGVFWSVKFAFFSPAYIDAPTQLGLLLILYGMQRRWVRWLPIGLLLGMLQKESLWAAAPALWIAEVRRRGGDSRFALRYGLSLTLPPLAVLAAIRWLIPSAVPYSAVEAIHYSGQALLDWREPMATALLALVSGSGLLGAWLLAHGPGVIRFWRRQPEWIVAGIAGALLIAGGDDKGRLLLSAVPALAVAGACGMEASESAGPRRTAWAAWRVLGIGLHLFLGGWAASLRDFDEYLNRWVPEHAMGPLRAYAVQVFFLLSAWLAGGWALRRHGGGRTDPHDPLHPSAGDSGPGSPASVGPPFSSPPLPLARFGHNL